MNVQARIVGLKRETVDVKPKFNRFEDKLSTVGKQNSVWRTNTLPSTVAWQEFVNPFPSVPQYLWADSRAAAKLLKGVKTFCTKQLGAVSSVSTGNLVESAEQIQRDAPSRKKISLNGFVSKKVSKTPKEAEVSLLPGLMRPAYMNDTTILTHGSYLKKLEKLEADDNIQAAQKQRISRMKENSAFFDQVSFEMDKLRTLNEISPQPVSEISKVLNFSLDQDGLMQQPQIPAEEKSGVFQSKIFRVSKSVEPSEQRMISSTFANLRRYNSRNFSVVQILKTEEEQKPQTPSVSRVAEGQMGEEWLPAILKGSKSSLMILGRGKRDRAGKQPKEPKEPKKPGLGERMVRLGSLVGQGGVRDVEGRAKSRGDGSSPLPAPKSETLGFGVEARRRKKPGIDKEAWRLLGKSRDKAYPDKIHLLNEEELKLLEQLLRRNKRSKPFVNRRKMDSLTSELEKAVYAGPVLKKKLAAKRSTSQPNPIKYHSQISQ